jgi:hypothetical protein
MITIIIKKFLQQSAAEMQKCRSHDQATHFLSSTWSTAWIHGMAAQDPKLVSFIFERDRKHPHPIITSIPNFLMKHPLIHLAAVSALQPQPVDSKTRHSDTPVVKGTKHGLHHGQKYVVANASRAYAVILGQR